jgi:hypothetical protein
VDDPTNPIMPPGWYTDAVNPSIERWFDGVTWSERVRPDSTPGAQTFPPEIATTRTTGRRLPRAAVPVAFVVTGLVLTWAAAALPIGAADDSAPGGTPGAAPGSFTTSMPDLRSQIAKELTSVGFAIVSVTCPADAPAFDTGTRFTCDVDTGGTPGTAEVTISDGGGWSVDYTPPSPG